MLPGGRLVPAPAGNREEREHVGYQPDERPEILLVRPVGRRGAARGGGSPPAPIVASLPRRFSAR